MVSMPELHLPDRPALIPYEGLAQALESCGLGPSADAIGRMIRDGLAPGRHGRLTLWLDAVSALPAAIPSAVSLDADVVTIGIRENLTLDGRARLRGCLEQLIPWRKGPFDLFGTLIDSEWRSDLKWNRVASEIGSLEGHTILDVGASNGYYAWRMAGAGARLIIGVDPTLVYVAQYLALARYLPEQPVFVIPVRVEKLPAAATGFDTVFSMGVIYHQREPYAHLRELHRRLRTGGQLVLETLIVPDGPTIYPKDRYARMRNVWAVPSLDALRSWLEQTGFGEIRLIDVTTTTSHEQRRTEWMPFGSLAQALDPSDPTKTVEGHAAPRRALLLANALAPVPAER